MKETRSLNDEIRQERKKGLEGKPFSYRVKYFAEYYKWYVLGGLLVILIIVSIVRTMLNHKESALCVAMVDANFEVDYEGFIHDYEIESGLEDGYEMTMDSTYATMTDGSGYLDMSSQEKLFVTIAGGQTDLVIAPAPAFERMAQSAYVKDLREVLSEEELDKYADRILIADVPNDPDDPNSGTTKVYAGIDISDAAKVKDGKWYIFVEDPVYCGICATSANEQRAVDFINYLW